MKINELSQPGVVQPNRGVTSRATSTSPAKPAESAGFALDQAEFHQTAKVESHLLEGAKLVYEAIPDVRTDRVAQAKQRLAEGFYNKPEVIDQIATRLAADPEARPSAPLSLAQQGEIKRRLSEGFYDTPEAIDKIANGLVEDVNA
jgi:anti-sigma28 factor (negative regulator of flagellin synthesis)